MANHTADGNATTNTTSGVDDRSGDPLQAIFEDGIGGAPEHAYVALLDWVQDAATRLALTILLVLAVIILGKLTKRSLEASAKRTATRHNLDDWKTRALISRTKPLTIVVKMGLWSAGFVVFLAVWGLRTGFLSLLTAAGFAGIVIGMAASNTLSNLIAGFIIFYNHPFDIGDWVEIDGTEGLVIDVRAGATMIETWDGEKVTFPNRIVEGTKVRNMSHQRKLRRRFRVGVDYATDVHAVRLKLLDLISSHPEVLKDPPPNVIGAGFNDSSIDLEIRYWVLPLRAQVMLIQTWLIEEIQRLFARDGVVIPFPQRTVVHRYPGAEPPPGDTVSTLAYDVEQDDRPFPAPPIEPPEDQSSTSVKQGQSPRKWFKFDPKKIDPRAKSSSRGTASEGENTS